MALARLRQALIAILLIVNAWLAPAWVQAQLLPALGDGAELSLGAEREFGERIVAELYRDPDYIADPVLQEYAQTMLAALLHAARERGELTNEMAERYAWQILLVRDRSVNAFALPGGFFGLHLGMIAVVATPDELASVLAHELSHVTQRHIARLIAQEKRQTPLMIGALILGALVASRSPDAGQAVMMGGSALAVQNQLNFSRDMEREADRVGFSLMRPAGYAPQGFVTMFDKLQAANRINDNGDWPYLRSHPLTSQRIADLHGRLPKGLPPAPPAPLVHAMMAARARVLMRPGIDAWRRWVVDAQAPELATRSLADRVGARTQGALAAVQLQEWALARRLVAALQADVRGDAPGTRQARLMAAELELDAGDATAALAALGNAGADASARPEMLLRTRVLLALGQAAPMAGVLQTWVTDHAHDAAAWQALAQVWHAQGQALRAVRAEGEAQAAHYDYAGAVDRFRAGQDLAHRSTGAQDYIEASIIDTRLRAVQSLLAQQTRERRVDQ
ncbi:MAG: M48 family metalloprotease [Comamonadaceae bacterium]|nr:M48 family metalloprotease [Comamonadaceae bacterium]